MTPCNNKLRIGLLGCSDIASRKFIPALNASSSATMAAISSSDPEEAASRVQIHASSILSHDELLARPDIDLVYISLRNHLHEEWTIRALKAGKHVICEKPLSTGLESSKRMISFARERHLLLYENLMFLHHPQHAVVRDIIASGRIGRVVAVRSFFGFPTPEPGNFRLDPAQGGGAFNDLSRYHIGTALNFLKGQPANPRGVFTWQGGLNTGFAGTATTDTGECFIFSSMFGQCYESCYEICCEGGQIRVDRAFTPPPDMPNKIKVLERGELTEIVVPAADQFKIMIDSVVGILKSGSYAEIHNRNLRIAELADLIEKGSLCE